jgi:hypothetical protein
MRRMMTLGLLSFVLAGLTSSAIAQTATAKPLSDSDIALLRQDLQTQKTAIIGAAMKLTQTEEGSFWSLYRDYANEQQQIGDLRLRIIKDYAANYGNMPDPKAGELSRKMIDVDRRTFELRNKYLPMFEKILAPKRAAKFFQVDRRLSLLIDLQLTSEIPVLE